MALPATDVFASNNVALTTYSASWSLNNGNFFLPSGASQNVQPNAVDTECAAFWNADAFNADQYSQGVIDLMTGSNAIGVGVRHSTTVNTANYYLFYSDNTNAYLYVSYNDGGNLDQLGSSGTKFSATNTVRLEASGTTITPKVNGSTHGIGAQTNSQLSSGAAGITGYGSGADALIDDWEGGNLGSAVTKPPPIRVFSSAVSRAASW